MHPDLETIRTALYSGQISAAKVDAQRAFERVTARLSHYQDLAEPRAPRAPPSPERTAPTATVVSTWDDIKEIFHTLWGNNASGKYDKELWKKLQTRLWRLEAATESLSPIARENLITALRRIPILKGT